MLGVGFQELLLILVVAVVVVGPKKLPDLAKSLGKGLQEFRKATDGIKSSLNENEAYKDLQGLKGTMQDAMSSLKPSGLLDLDAKPAPSPAPELKKYETPLTAAEGEAPEPILEPKKPVENLEGRIVLIDGIVSEHHQPAAEALAPLSSQDDQPAGQPPTVADPQPGTPSQSAEAPKKTYA
ncbi:sec-independent protein translocase protein TatB [Desulfarculales bacterium]